MRVFLQAMLLGLALSTALCAQSQPLLQLQGQPYFGGNMSLHLAGPVGQPALLAYGLEPLPLDEPIQTSKGAWYIGSLVNLVAIGSIPSGGRINLPFTMPPAVPAVAGLQLVMQGYVPFALSNPATLPLDTPHYLLQDSALLTATVPMQAADFGDRIASGDFNADGAKDLAAGAWSENDASLQWSGRAYVLWGPDFTSSTPFSSPNPKAHGHFGCGIAVADISGDGIDDVIVAETTGGDPPTPTAFAHLYVYAGSSSFSTVPSLALPSAGTGFDYALHGRRMTTGDFDGDGSADIAVGVFLGSTTANEYEGWIDVYWGPNYGSPMPLYSPDPGVNDFFGNELCTADVNGDGIDDLVESSARETAGGTWGIGRAHLFVGPTLSPYKTIENPLPAGSNSWFGNAVAAADMNADGMADVLITDQKDHAFIFWSPDFTTYQVIDRPPPWIVGNEDSASFGYFATLADVNDDGQADAVVSDVFSGTASSCSLSKGGIVFVALAPYFATFHVLTAKVPECGAEFGWSLHSVDLDGDERVELLVGSDLGDVGAVTGAGHITLFSGN